MKPREIKYITFTLGECLYVLREGHLKTYIQRDSTQAASKHQFSKYIMSSQNIPSKNIVQNRMKNLAYQQQRNSIPNKSSFSMEDFKANHSSPKRKSFSLPRREFTKELSRRRSSLGKSKVRRILRSAIQSNNI